MIEIFENVPAPSEHFLKFSKDFPMLWKMLEDFPMIF